MRIALLANPESGSGDAAEIADDLRARGATVAEHDLEAADDAAAGRPDRIVVAGGDGSVGCAAAAAAQAGIPLAVVAVGTANDFARTLGLPRDRDGAVAIALGGERTRRLDLAWLETENERRPFLNAASVGLSPIAARRARPLKGLIGPLSYAVGALRAGLSAHPVECRVSCDGELLHSGPAWQASVVSTGAFGGGAEVDADPQDGALDVVVIAAGSRLRLVLHAYGLRAGRLEAQRGVRRARGRTVEISTAASSGFNVDGELLDLAAARFTVEPSAVEVVVA